MTVSEKLSGWLRSHDERLDRFVSPIPVAEVARETGLPEEAILFA